MKTTCILTIAALFVACGPPPAPDYPEPDPEEHVADQPEEPASPAGEASVDEESAGDEAAPPLEPAEEPAAGPPAPETVEEAAAEPPAPEPIEGTIVSHKAKLVIVSSDAALPAEGAQGTLYKFFEQELFGMKASGWLDIASVTVKKADAKKVHLEIVEEHSETMVNGKKMDHFKKGNLVKIEIQ